MNKLITILVGLLIIITPFAYLCVRGLCAMELYAAVVSLIVMLALLGSILKAKTIRITLVDTLIAGLFLWLFLSFFVVNPSQTEPIILTQIYTALALYFVAKTYVNRRMLLYAIMICGLIQGVWALAQQLYIVETINHFRFISGSFGNPGLLGLILALAITAGAYLALKEDDRNRKIAIIGISLFLVYIMFLSDSRAAWFATIIGVGGVLYCNLDTMRTLLRRPVVRIVGLIVIAGVVVGLYIYKMDSANGRLLIWQAGIYGSTKHLFLGGGMGSFAHSYMLDQASFFAENPNSELAQYASNVVYPFNELLRVLYELGIVGMVLVLASTYVILFRTRASIEKQLLLVFGLFALFSYPLANPTFVIILAILCAAISHRAEPMWERRIAYPWKIAGAVATVGFLGVSCYVFAIYKNPTYERLPNNNSVANSAMYEQTVAAYPDIRKLQRIAETVPSVELYTFIGTQLHKSDRLSLAKHYLSTADNMAPNMVGAKQALFNIYKQENKGDSAAIMAKKIVELDAKVTNTQTIRFKIEAQQFLDSLKQ